MALIDRRNRTIHYKIAYYGPTSAGKTSSLWHIHQSLGRDVCGELFSCAPETKRALFFECTQPRLPSIGAYRVRVHLYTVPGAAIYEQTRTNILVGVDGIVFVADSQPHSRKANIDLWREMECYIEGTQRPLSQIPLVVQYHKRDLPDRMAIATMQNDLRSLRLPDFATDIDERSGGIMDAFDTITRMVAAQQEKTYGADR